MYYVLILSNLILLLAALGLFACLKKSPRDDEKCYQSLYSSEEAIPRIRSPAYDQTGANGYQVIYENPHFVDFRPPPYNENLALSENADFSLSYSAFLYSNPPMTNVMNFYFFNITNPDEFLYNGEKPQLVEVGPYPFIESEEKKYSKFSDDGTKMFYQNYKKYSFSEERISKYLSYNDKIMYPNSIAVGAFSSVFGKSTNLSQPIQFAVSVAFMLIGEYSIITQNVRESLFDGFNEPLLDLLHSDLVNIFAVYYFGSNSVLKQLVPQMKTFAYFSNYNNTYDENYWVNTGKKDINKLGVIESWAGLKKLPKTFWPSDYARQIRGSDSGSLCKMNLNEKDELPLFISFMCRSFTSVYLKNGNVNGFDTMLFAVPPDDYDTTLDKNTGFRYPNFEQADYYPDWPGHVNSPPFTTLISPPHFLYSPKQVQTSLSVISPDSEKHRPIQFHHEKLTGTVLKANVRLQINIPISNNEAALQTAQIPNIIVPLFWQDSEIILRDFVYNKLWLSVIVIPIIVQCIQYFLIVIGVVILIAVVFYQWRCKRTTF
ncbi:unnamed protein product [Caenorhabditis bovis]|uniref:Uncharacterized protein n=1 Tax=Caenorhabditis bovis TaxID=2654633 RepID=A0A8S1EH62_9PELO|nr:unnamed protein product [Caenorhabditis bovis]